MAPLLSIDADTGPITRALLALPSATQRLVNDACAATAHAIVTEAKARLSRQLKGTSRATAKRPDRGQNLTLEGIEAFQAPDGIGWIVISDREPFPRLSLWLEKGTHAGKRKNYARTPAEPYFYASIALEVNNHTRRVQDAMAAAAQESGLGG